jgi:predicted outer membrane protein
MLRNARSQWLVGGLAGAFMACTSGHTGSSSMPSTTPVATTTSTTTATTTTSSGDVALTTRRTITWVDSAGGVWMDSTGAVWTGGNGATAGAMAMETLAGMNNQNIVAHLATGDSLEIALSRKGAERAKNPAVSEFAARMVAEHTAHMQMVQQTATQGGIAPMPAVGDTLDLAIANRLTSRLQNATDYDRQLMRAEVMMHQHMLRDLMTVQPLATGPAKQIVDQTIPVVQQHLSDAQGILRQVVGTGGGSGMSPR